MFPKLFLKPKTRYRTLALISLVVVAAGLALIVMQPKAEFDGERALADAAYQMSLGPRTVGSEAHAQAGQWIADTLADAGWDVEVQVAEMMGHPIRNIIAKRGQGEPWIVLGAHYDSRLFADHDADPARQVEPVPGANDGASGVAVLTELGRVIPQDLDAQVWLVFFDAEDNGSIEGWDWILGSRAFVDSLTEHPDAAIIVDMIGDADLDIYLERNSDSALSAEIWAQAAQLGYEDKFINSIKFSMLDDHTPFLAKDIPAADLIDFDYPYWHTTEDTLDKISAESLNAVGDTLLAWLLSK
jgi:hypothetical protein